MSQLIGDLVLRVGPDPDEYAKLDGFLADTEAGLKSIEQAAEATDFSVLIEGLGSVGGQMNLLAESALHAEDSMQQLALFDVNSIQATDEAFGSLAQSLGTIETEADKVEPALDGAGASAKNAGDAARDSGIEWEKLGEQLLKIAEFAGLGLGLEELASEALHAFAAAQTLEASFEFIGKNAELAASQVQQLRDMSMQLAVPFNEVAAAAQKMAPALGGFSETLPLLKAAADDAKELGISFSTVAQSMENMALRGTLMSRSLSSLGISMKDVADTMNQTSASVAAAFKDETVEERIQTLIDATGRYADASKEQLGTLASEWTNFRNTLDFALDDLGKALAPIAAAFLEFAGGVLTALRPAFQGIGEVLSALTPVINEMGSAVKGLSDVFGGDILVTIVGLTGALYGMQAAVQVAGAAVAGWELGKWLYDNSSAFKIFGDSIADGIIAIDRWLNKNQLLAEANAAMGDVFAKEQLAEQSAIATAAKLQEMLAARGIVIQQGTMSLDDYSRALAQAAAATGGLASGQDKIAKGAQDIIDKQNQLDAAVEQARRNLIDVQIEYDNGTASQNAYTRAQEDLQKAISAATPKLKEVKDGIKSVNDELTKEGDQLVTIEDKIGPAMKKFQDDINAGIDPSKAAQGLVSIENQFDEFMAHWTNTAAGATENGKRLMDAAQSQRDAIAGIVLDANVNALPVVATKVSGAMRTELDAFNEFGVKVPPLAVNVGAAMRDMMVVESAYADSLLTDLPLWDAQAAKFNAMLNPIGRLDEAFKTFGLTIGDDFASKLQKIATDLEFVVNSGQASVYQLQEAFDKALSSLSKFPETAAALIPELQAAIDKMEAMHGINLQILNDQVNLDKAAVNAAISEGQSADAVLLLQERLAVAAQRAADFRDSSAALAQLYTQVTAAFSQAWTAFGTGIGDAIVGAESFKQAFTSALDAVEKKLSELVVNYFMGELKRAITENTNLIADFQGFFNKIFGIGGDVAKGFSNTEKGVTELDNSFGDFGETASKSMQQVTKSTQDVGNAAVQTTNSLTSMLTMIGTIIGAIAGIIGDIEMAHMQKQLSVIEGETRRTANALENGVVPQILDADQHLFNIDGMLSGQYWTLFVSMSSDLDSIAADVHQLMILAMTSSGGGGSAGGDNAQSVQAALLAASKAQAQAEAEATAQLAKLNQGMQQATTTVDTAIPVVSQMTTAVSEVAPPAVAAATALGNLGTAITYAENSFNKAGDVFVSAAQIIQQLIVPSGAYNNTGDSSIQFNTPPPPGVPYTPGAYGNNGDNPFAGHNPGSAPWSPPVLSFYQVMGPAAQSTADALDMLAAHAKSAAVSLNGGLSDHADSASRSLEAMMQTVRGLGAPSSPAPQLGGFVPSGAWPSAQPAPLIGTLSVTGNTISSQKAADDLIDRMVQRLRFAGLRI